MRAYRLVLVACILSCALAVTITTRLNPVVLHIDKKGAGGRQQGRTKPEMIQRIMGLIPGTQFCFDLEKWRSIVSSGLFHNLTVQTVATSTGAYVNVSGTEAPSLSIAPEISVTASLESPEVQGGVRVHYSVVTIFVVLICRWVHDMGRYRGRTQTLEGRVKRWSSAS